VRTPILGLFVAICLAPSVWAQQPVTIRVDAGSSAGPLRPIYGYFGYDEPNYTYAKNGQKLVAELADLSSQPVYIRTHFLLATGDGSPAFKWGSTNAYTEDPSGKPIYDWTVVDRILATYLHARARPFVEIGFMPEALSSNSKPYRPVWAPGESFDRYYVGWAYPPKDYAKWDELIYQWVRHTVETYGKEAVESWYWEVWNEPDIAYWHGTPEEYDKLYDHTAAAVKRALPSAKVGGPASTGPANPKAASFLRQFLEHCAAQGSPLDFISYHAKGRPSVVDGHVRMGIAKHLDDVETGMEIVGSFPKFRNLPVVLSESDPEGCAACSARVYPQNAYRNGPLYAAYTAVMLNEILKLAERHQANIVGMLTWAFEFEGQPYFDGFRTLATNGIDKPVLNLFRMAGLLGAERLRVESSAAQDVEAMRKSGVTQAPLVDALASRGERKVAVLVWNYHDDDFPAPAAQVHLTVGGLPATATRLLVRHYRIDQEHSNAYAVWKQMGSPQSPTQDQYAKLEQAGQLELLESPRWLWNNRGASEIDFSLPRQGTSLIEWSW
jgi:xylan 1,4-beta-xylosidase